MQSERTLRTIADGNFCEACLADKDEPKRTLATHSTTDAQQLGDGSWQETRPRYGCADHKVVPVVILVDGTKVDYNKYAEQEHAN